MNESERSVLIEQAKRSIDNGAELNDVLASVRSQGGGRIDAAIVLRSAAGMELADAKRAIESSTVWVDMREHDQRLWDELSKIRDAKLK